MTETSAKILVVTLSNLGDGVLALPVIETLLARYPACDLHVMAGTGAAVLFEKDARIGRLTVLRKKMPLAERWRFIQAVRRERYDVIVDLRRSLIGLFGGAKRRNAYWNPLRSSIHKRRQHLSALRGLADIPQYLEPFLSAWTDTAPAEGLDTDTRRLVVAAPGSKSDLKKWPAASYASLLDRLAILHDCRIALVGDKADQADIELVRSQMSTTPLDLGGRTDLKGLCALLRRAALLVTNDSAPLHIADSLGVPVLALFGPTDPRKYGPTRTGSAVARRELFCAPCEQAQCHTGDHACLQGLGADQVYKQAVKVLEGVNYPAKTRILVVRLDRIGDLVLSFPAIQALRENFPSARISLMVRPFTKAIAEACPWVDEVIEYDYRKRTGRHRFPIGYWRFIREIIERRFDAAFVLHPGLRSHLVPFLAGIPYRVGYRSGVSSRLLTKKVRDRRHLGQKHESEYALDVIRAMGVRLKGDRAVPIQVFPEDRDRLAAKLGAAGVSPEQRWIAVHPGASCVSKRWPVEHFAELCRRLAEDGRRILVIGGGEVRPAAERLVRAAGDACISLAGELDLKETAALLERSELLISNDSGPVHIAAALGTRTFTIFGRNAAGLSPVRWKAWGRGHRFIQKDVGCAVCLAHACTIDFECLKKLSPDEVFSGVSQMLQEAAVR